jgi:hypothetical protein
VSVTKKNGAKRLNEKGILDVVPLQQEVIIVVQGLKRGKRESEKGYRTGGCEGGTVFDLSAVVLCRRSRCRMDDDAMEMRR